MDLVTTHSTADLDGVASMVALALLEGPLELALVGGMDSLTRRFWTEHAGALPPLVPARALLRRVEREPLGRLWVVDTSDVARLGPLAPYVPRFREVRAWDTHPVVAGQLPRVPLPAASACTTGLVLRLEAEGRAVRPVEAGLFLLGIHVDTGHFTFRTTTELDHRAAALCRAWGAPGEWAEHYVPRGFTSRQLALLEQMARSTELIHEGDTTVALCVLELDHFEPDLSLLLEQLREAEHWPAAFVFAACGERIFAIGRGGGHLDVGATLRALGGGGHVDAASAVLRGLTVRDARLALRQAIAEAVGRRRSAAEVASPGVFALPAAASVQEAADEMHRRRVNCLPLTGSDPGGGARVFVGVVTRQEVDAAQRHGLGARPVAEISSRAPRWVAPDAPLQGVREALLEGTHRLVLVGTPPGDARGVITRTSLFRAWARELPQARHERPPPPDSTVGRLRRALGPTWSRLVEVGDAAARLGMSAWLVGGSVRDFLLDLPVRDVDVVVEGDGRAVARATREVIGGRLHVHDLFATATIALDDGPSIDLATARTEYYRAPAALPEVVHAGLRQDLFRRDFTINAVAIALGPSERGVIQDPFGGLGDLKHGLLRVLHGLSFHDDPSRAWRAARFAARFDFRVTPETEGLLLAARRTGVFERLPLDRAGRELHLILSEDEVVQSFRLLRDWGLLATVHAAFGADRVLLDELLAVAAARQRFAGVHGGEVVVPEQADVLWLVVASRVPVGDREARAALLPWPRRQMRHWVDGPERVDGALGRLARASSGSTAGRILERLDSCERIYAAGVCADPRASEWLAWWEREGRLVASAVDGARLEAAGYAPGPAFGPALAAALDAARDGADAAAQLVAARAVMMQMAQQEEVAPTRRASPRRRTSER